MDRTARIAALAYGSLCYAVFFVTFLYLIGWVTGLVVPTALDAAAQPGALGAALATDAALLALFALQHSVMARPGFKTWWTRLVPRPAERATYVLASSLALIALLAFWQPLPGTLWSVETGWLRDALTAGSLAGFGIVLVSTWLIDHFDLFGLRQVYLYFRGKPYSEKRFVTPGPYRHIRHPLYVGWLLAFWVTPVMTTGHLFFALLMTAYVLVAIRYEERDLAAALGEPYRSWRARTPMFVPRLGQRSEADERAPRPAEAR